MLHQKSILVKVTVHQWGGQKVDRKISKAVADSSRADEGSGSYTKHLLPKNAFKEINLLTSEIRRHVEVEALPWSEPFRLLPIDNLFPFREKLTKLRDRFEVAVETFMKKYELQKNLARNYLGSTFRESDYPDIDVIREKFRIDVEFQQVPADDFRVELDEQELAALRSEVLSDRDSKYTQAVNNLKDKLITTALNFKERIENQTIKHAKTSVFDKAIALYETAPSLNLTDDPQINTVSRAMYDFLTKNNRLTLKASQSLQSEFVELINNLTKGETNEHDLHESHLQSAA